MSEKKEWKHEANMAAERLLMLAKEQEAKKPCQAVRVDDSTIIFVPLGCNVSEHVEAWKQALNKSREMKQKGGKL